MAKGYCIALWCAWTTSWSFASPGFSSSRSHRGVVGCRRTDKACLMLVAPEARERFAMATLATKSRASSIFKFIHYLN